MVVDVVAALLSGREAGLLFRGALSRLSIDCASGRCRSRSDPHLGGSPRSNRHEGRSAGSKCEDKSDLHHGSAESGVHTQAAQGR